MRLCQVGLVTFFGAFLVNADGVWSAGPLDGDLRWRMIYECYGGEVGAVVELSRKLETLDYRKGPFLPRKCLDIENGDSWTPLTAAIAGRHWAIASYLIGCGASADLATGNRYTPIWLVAYMADGEPQAAALAKLLLKCGANVQAYPTGPPSHHPETPLHQAVMNGEVEITRLLLAYGADLDESVDHAPSARSCGVELHARIIEVEPLPFLRSRVDWKRRKEMYDLLKNTPRPRKATGEEGNRVEDSSSQGEVDDRRSPFP